MFRSRDRISRSESTWSVFSLSFVLCCDCQAIFLLLLVEQGMKNLWECWSVFDLALLFCNSVFIYVFSFQWIVCVIKKVYSPGYIEFILLPLSCSGHWVPTSFKVFPLRRKFMRCQMRWDVCRSNRFKGRHRWAKILAWKLQLMSHNLELWIHRNVILLQGRECRRNFWILRK